MATIVFVPYPENGHLNSTLKLANSLKLCGHQIRYLGIPDLEEYVHGQGYEFISVFGDLFPKGYMQEQSNKNMYSTGIKLLIKKKQQLEHAHNFSKRLLEGELSNLIREIKPDLFIIDSLVSFFALIAYQNNVSSALLTTTLPRSMDSQVPPLSSKIIPKNTFISKLTITFAWWKIFMRYFFTDILLAFLGMSQIRIHQVTKKLAVQANYPLKNINYKVEFSVPLLRIPELVISPQEFDFPRGISENRFYIGASVAFDRTENKMPLLWNQIDNEKLLIYCSLGSQTHRYSMSRRFFQIVINAMVNKQDWQLVLSIGNCISTNDFQSVPSNVFLVNWAPQMEILKKASVMISHGGFNSVKECIFFGVPMILFPCYADQPGCAARVVHHGLGVMGNIKTVSVKKIHSLIDTVCDNPLFKKKIETMGNKFKEIENSGNNVKIIEAILNKSINCTQPWNKFN